MVKGLKFSIKFVFVILLALAFFSHVMLTLEFDEAWILTTIAEANSSSKPIFPADSVTTTGGPYFIIQSILFQFFGANHYIARFTTFFALVLLLLAGRKIALNECQNGDQWLSISFVLAVPGTIILAGTAYGTILSLFFLFAFFYFWTTANQALWRNRLISGLLLACSITTRVDLLAAIPALIFTSFFLKEEKRDHLKSGIFISVIALFFIALSVSLQMYAQGSFKNGISMLLRSTGFRNFDMGIYISDLLNRISLTQDYLPLSIMALSTWCLYRFFSPKWTFFAWISWIILFLWIFRSPYPYYRYFYSVVLINMFVLSICLMKLVIWSEKNKIEMVKNGIYWVTLCFMLQGSASAIRSLAQGDLSTQNLEWARVAPYQTFNLFDAPQKQQQLAQWLHDSIPPEAEVITIRNAMPLSYLSGRNLIPDWYAKKNTISFSYLLLPPNTPIPKDVESRGKLLFEQQQYQIYLFDPQQKLSE